MNRHKMSVKSPLRYFLEAVDNSKANNSIRKLHGFADCGNFITCEYFIQATS